MVNRTLVIRKGRAGQNARRSARVERQRIGIAVACLVMLQLQGALNMILQDVETERERAASKRRI